MMSCFSFLFRKKRAPLVRRTCEIEEVVSGIHNIILYSYKDLKIATENFSSENKIGMGGFGSVYKGRLKDGTAVAIKVLSAESRQGVREFLTEINVIASIEHHNLVKLYGCCVEEDQRILVYGYLENNSLEQTLLGRNCNNIQFNWQTRRKICIGVAEGLAFLHEEVHPHVIHRDIKASNILLDKDLSPKISDFGLAKLIPANLTHISTRVAGTVGYLAPEYAIRGQVTRKSDIYSFGVLLVEIVSGRCNTNKRLPPNEQYLLERVWVMYEQGQLMALVDTALSEDVDIKEACRFLKIGLVCTQEMPKLRPLMSTVVEMLNGQIDVDDKILSKPGLLSGLMDMRDIKGGKEKVSSKDASYVTSADSGNHSQSSSSNMFNSNATMTFNSIYDRSN